MYKVIYHYEVNGEAKSFVSDVFMTVEAAKNTFLMHLTATLSLTMSTKIPILMKAIWLKSIVKLSREITRLNM